MRRFLLPLAALLLTAQGGQNFPQESPQGNRNPNVQVPLLALLPNRPHSDQIGSGSLAGSKGETLTFTRATTKTCPTSSSAVVSVASGQPCVGPSGLLVEAAHTNRLLQSESIGTAPWNLRGTTAVTPNAGVAPDGTTTAALMTAVGTYGQDDFYQVASGFATGAVSPSFWVKKVTAAGTLKVGDPASGLGVWLVDFSLLGTGWERVTAAHPAVTISIPFTTTGNNGLQIGAVPPSSLSFYFWRPHIEDGSITHSPVPTTTVAATSNADVAKLPAKAPVASGAVSLDFTPLWATTGGDLFLLSTTDTSFHDGLLLKVRSAAPTNGLVVQVCNGSGCTTVASGNLAAWTPGQKYHVKVVWGAGKAWIYRDGTLVASDTSGTVAMPTVANLVTVGALPGGSNQADGYISNLQFTQR